MQITNYFFKPALTPLIEKRTESLLIGGAVALQFGLVAVGLPGWPCPFKAAFGIPCPGCGLSTAVSSLVHGDWQAAITTHAFAPIFLLGLILILAVSILPQNTRLTALEKIRQFEERTGIMAILLVSLLVYWGFRLIWL